MQISRTASLLEDLAARWRELSSQPSQARLIGTPRLIEIGLLPQPAVEGEAEDSVAAELRKQALATLKRKKKPEKEPATPVKDEPDVKRSKVEAAAEVPDVKAVKLEEEEELEEVWRSVRGVAGEVYNPNPEKHRSSSGDDDRAAAVDDEAPSQPSEEEIISKLAQLVVEGGGKLLCSDCSELYNDLPGSRAIVKAMGGIKSVCKASNGMLRFQSPGVKGQPDFISFVSTEDSIEERRQTPKKGPKTPLFTTGPKTVTNIRNNEFKDRWDPS